MTDVRVIARWIDLLHCDDPRDVVHQTVASLAQGGLIGLATETEYALAACALHEGGLARLRRLGDVPDAQPLILVVRSAEECQDWVPGISQVGRRLATRLWPGPLTLVFPAGSTAGLLERLPPGIRRMIAPEGALAMRSLADPFLRDVLALTPAPLVLGPLPPAARTRPISADAILSIAGLDLFIDSGPAPKEQQCTRVRVEQERWTVEQAGAVDYRTLTQMSGLIVLFICTGNTCRSPMAEAICRLMLARRLNCAPDELEGRGFVVQSAGVAASSGSPAASHAIDVLRSMGGSLENHRSRRATLEMVRQADCIFAMTGDHLDALLDAVPEVQEHSYLLDPQGGDVPDPIGSDHQTYRHTAQMIEQMLEVRLQQLGL